jgi:hypothetical protein
MTQRLTEASYRGALERSKDRLSLSEFAASLNEVRSNRYILNYVLILLYG